MMAGESVAGRSGASSAGTAMCAVMMESTSLLDRRAKRDQLHRVEARPIGRDRWQRHVAVHRRVAMAGKMFGRGQNAILRVGSRAFDKGPHVRGHHLRTLRRRSGY